ncbi:hypothetical protein DIPPA_10103 [Diplonema papillatum]|nr:hypothetical protein DIPPA_10103 [Diplonema papillatum]
MDVSALDHIRSLVWVRHGHDTVLAAGTTSDDAAGGSVHLLQAKQNEKGLFPGTVLRGTAALDDEASCLRTLRDATCVIAGTSTGRLWLASVEADGDGLCLSTQHSFQLSSAGVPQAAVTALSHESKHSGDKVLVGTEAGCLGYVDVVSGARLTLRSEPKFCQMPIVGIDTIAPGVFAVASGRSLAIYDVRESKCVYGPAANEPHAGAVTCVLSRQETSELFVGSREGNSTGSLQVMDLRSAGTLWSLEKMGKTALPPNQGPGAFGDAQPPVQGGWPVAMALYQKQLLVACHAGSLLAVSCSASPAGPVLLRANEDCLLPPTQLALPLTALAVAGTAAAVGTRGHGVTISDLSCLNRRQDGRLQHKGDVPMLEG